LRRAALLRYSATGAILPVRLERNFRKKGPKSSSTQ
jgi:hypothetical protein